MPREEHTTSCLKTTTCIVLGCANYLGNKNANPCCSDQEDGAVLGLELS